MHNHLWLRGQLSTYLGLSSNPEGGWVFLTTTYGNLGALLFRPDPTWSTYLSLAFLPNSVAQIANVFLIQSWHTLFVLICCPPLAKPWLLFCRLPLGPSFLDIWPWFGLHCHLHCWQLMAFCCEVRQDSWWPGQLPVGSPLVFLSDQDFFHTRIVYLQSLSSCLFLKNSFPMLPLANLHLSISVSLTNTLQNPQNRLVIPFSVSCPHPTTWWGFASCWSLQLDGKAGPCMSLFVPSVENMGIINSNCWMNEWILQLVSFIFFMDFYFSFPNLFAYNSITGGHCLFVLFYHAYFLSTIFFLDCFYCYVFEFTFSSPHFREKKERKNVLIYVVQWRICNRKK